MRKLAILLFTILICTTASAQLVDISLSAPNPLIVPRGGSFQYEALVTSNLSSPYNVDFWTYITLPNGTWYGPLQRINNIPMTPTTIIGPVNLSLAIPQNAFLGDYIFHMQAGLFPTTVVGEDEFSFEVVEHGDILEQDFELGNTGTYVTMVWIEPGTFMMGSLDNDPDADDREFPRHQVTLTEGFWMGKYEVTQEQWVAVMGDRDFYFDGRPTHPAESINHDDISNDFLPAVNATEPGDPWRLPTEAEWEYACRAGHDGTRFWWGDDPGYGGLGDYAWYTGNNDPYGTKPVGQKIPNPWGLYDMHGNVWEWCSDWYDSDYYDISPSTDPQGPANGSFRLLRGGSWGSLPLYCRSAYRGYSIPSRRSVILGFRLVRVSPSP